MNLSDAFLKAGLGANITPPNIVGTGGLAHIGAKFDLRLDAATYIWSARAIFGANAQTLAVTPHTGTLTPSAVGFRQEEVFVVFAPAGCTAAGTLNLVVTGAGITGSPLQVPVPLNPKTHRTDVLIAEAFVTKLSSMTQLAAFDFSIVSGARVMMRRRFPAANDGALNVAIPAGLGITAVSTSTSYDGATGVVIERVGGDGEDLFGSALGSSSETRAFIVASSSASEAQVNSSFMTSLRPGEFCLFGAPAGYESPNIGFTATGKSIIDIVCIG